MNISVSRKKKLPAFRLELAELEALISKLTPEFAQDRKVRIHITLKDSQYDFESVNEIRNCTDLPIEIFDFIISVRDDKKSCRISSDPFYSTSEVIAQSEGAAWCAGVVEVVVTFINTYRRWYSPIVGEPISFVVFFSPILFSFLLSPTFASINTHSYWWLPFSLIWVVCLIINLFPKRTLPSSVLQIKQMDSFFRKYIPELTLLISLIAVVISSIELFVK